MARRTNHYLGQRQRPSEFRSDLALGPELMKILITGGSSFTGYWFIKELAARGHAITAVVRGNKDQYSGLRKARIEQVAGWADIAWNCSFGDDTFLQLLDN